MPLLSRRSFLAATAAGAAVSTLARPARGAARPAAPLVLNDASRLNPVPVARNAILRPESDDALIAALRALLKEAADEWQPVCVGGARHSMGGQSLMRDGVAALLATPLIEPDTARRVMRVRAGTRWRDVIAALDPLGLSPAVTQSNHDFSVGGTLSVNAHGWPVPYGPFGTTVRSFRLMLADGTLVTCSRGENAELFSLAVGGYGLFGIVIDAELELADNVLLAARHEVMPAHAFAPRFAAVAREAGVRMAYGRLSVARDNYLGAAALASDRVLALGGSYYLPYRLHARADQLRAAYPRIEEFSARKRSYDPQLRFRNTMWEKYFA